MENQRSQRRVKVFKGAVIAFAGTTVPCMVRNLTESGAMLELKSRAGIPDHFELRIQAESFVRQCRVIWVTEAKLGVSFADKK
jgi:hypothetical protein